MNQSYNVEHNNNKYNLSLQTDPDLYALKNKKKNTSYKAETTTTSTVSVSNNRLAYVEALVGKYIFMYIYIQIYMYTLNNIY